MEIIDAVAKSVPGPHKVDLKNPDKTIVVEIAKVRMPWSVWSSSEIVCRRVRLSCVLVTSFFSPLASAILRSTCHEALHYCPTFLFFELTAILFSCLIAPSKFPFNVAVKPLFNDFLEKLSKFVYLENKANLIKKKNYLYLHQFSKPPSSGFCHCSFSDFALFCVT